ncbi:LLM class flavin-dependent oxidoreductase [Mesonia sp.]|uniref:LLM class flavin-dependent oxidoreductase n=1 Tax=Mesonia sp. TaxID=1960830 RepID=UPI000C8ED68B|nr:LLM class flavin-dependent oxidoreductase [Mesonia sp.]MAN25765.1 hypothetical protein [Mesonia sp.]|tara:strand:- start:9342 stop:10274 length:933 start_codon:yes stop_codon:yes gene_type:complete
MDKLRLGILEFGTGGSIDSLTKIETIIEYARRADELGFSKFWLSEHHQFYKNAPWSNPEMLLPIIAAMTDRINVGLAGILLNIHSPYRVALNFKLLANLFPGRIDIGFAKGIPNNSKIIRDLSGQYTFSKTNFFKRLDSILYYFREDKKLLGEEIIIPPLGGEIPKLWYLASSNKSLEIALEKGLDYSRTIFHEKSDLTYKKDQLFEFQEKFLEKHDRKANVNIAIAGFLGKSNKQALSEYRKINGDDSYHKKIDNSSIVGCINEFYDKIFQYQECYGVDEFIFFNMETNPNKKLENLEILSSAFNLKIT